VATTFGALHLAADEGLSFEDFLALERGLEVRLAAPRRVRLFVSLILFAHASSFRRHLKSISYINPA
jgi:hypothetical protein